MRIHLQGRLAEMLRAVTGPQIVDVEARLGQGEFDDAVTDDMDVITDDTDNDTLALAVVRYHRSAIGGRLTQFETKALIGLGFDRAAIELTRVAGDRKMIEMHQVSRNHVVGQPSLEILFQRLFR